MKRVNWLKVLQGALGILFGVLLIVFPVKSFVLIAWLLGLYLVLEAVLLVILAFMVPRAERTATILMGIISLVVGLIIMSGTVTVLTLLVFIFALWSLVSGIIQLLMAVFKRDENEEFNYLLVLGGLFSIFIAILLFVYPLQIIGFVQVIFGLGILAGGISTLVYSIKAK